MTLRAYLSVHPAVKTKQMLQNVLIWENPKPTVHYDHNNEQMHKHENPLQKLNRLRKYIPLSQHPVSQGKERRKLAARPVTAKVYSKSEGCWGHRWAVCSRTQRQLWHPSWETAQSMPWSPPTGATSYLPLTRTLCLFWSTVSASLQLPLWWTSQADLGSSFQAIFSASPFPLFSNASDTSFSCALVSCL